MPDVSTWIKSQFYTNSWTFASDVRILNFSFPTVIAVWLSHATLASELSRSQFYTRFWRLTLISCEGGAPGPTKFAFCHMFAHLTRTISAEGCPGTNKTRISPHVWVSDTPQKVTFCATAWLSLPPERNRGTGEVWFCRSSDTIWSPGSSLNSCVTISVQMTLQSGVL